VIERVYEWQFAGEWYSIRRRWSEFKLEALRNLPHDVAVSSGYSYYLKNDPFKQEAYDFLADVVDVMSRDIVFEEEAHVLAALLTFVQHLNYYEERGEYPRYPAETIIDQGGDCEDTAILMAFIARRLGYNCAFIHFSLKDRGHVDLGVAPNFRGEFSGSFWRHNGLKYYYIHCNGKYRTIGEYSGRWGDKARIEPVH